MKTEFSTTEKFFIILKLLLAIGFLLWVILGGTLGIAWGGEIYQPMESEYYSTLDDHGENLSLAMENADRNMIEYLSCPNVNPDGIWCKIWRNNHLSTLLD